AGDLWGLTAQEATVRLAERLGPRFHSAVIGPAGEHRVRYATISHENRHAGRGGLGAVLGARRPKAVAVAGSRLGAGAGRGAVARVGWSTRGCSLWARSVASVTETWS